MAPRRTTFIPAYILYGDHAVECIVRNVSDTGAKVEVSGVGKIPVTCTLFPKDHPPQNCRVVRRAIKEIGVEFI